jgi:hypothetical protein
MIFDKQIDTPQSGNQTYEFWYVLFPLCQGRSRGKTCRATTRGVIVTQSVPKGSNNPADALVDEKTALWGGIAATILLGLPALLIAISGALNLGGKLFWVIFSGYFIGLAVQYWTAKSYKNGLTVNETIKAVLWPVDTYQTIRAAVRKEQGKTVTVPVDDSKTLLSETWALVAGVGVGILALVFVPLAVSSLLGAIGAVIWFAVWAYVVGVFVQFWTSQAYRDGLTRNELLLAALWPVDTFKTVRAGVKARLNA